MPAVNVNKTLMNYYHSFIILWKNACSFLKVDPYSNSGGSYLSTVIFYFGADLNIRKHIQVIINAKTIYEHQGILADYLMTCLFGKLEKPLKQYHYMFSILMYCNGGKNSASGLPLFQFTQMILQVTCTFIYYSYT